MERGAGDVPPRCLEQRRERNSSLAEPSLERARRRAQAVRELYRVTKPGGHVLVSVMGLGGAVIHFASFIVELARRDGPAKSLEIARTGFLPEGEGYGHLSMRMYLWEELEDLLGPAHGSHPHLGVGVGAVIDDQLPITAYSAPK